jgi:dsRNA-specific ribonuclease
MKSFVILSKQIGITDNDLKHALTHNSFFKIENTENDNSRLIFAGMFVFKGQLAEILLKYLPGKGTQLQHILGNLFRIEYLNSLFDNWKLFKHIRAAENFDIKAQKHIFVYAILGCIASADENTRRRFMFKWFLNEQNKHILQHHVKNENILFQADFFAKDIYKEHIKISVEQQENGGFKAQIKIKDGFLISEAESKSYRYARKKALKSALLLFAEIKFSEMIRSTDYLERIKTRVENERNEKIRINQEKAQLTKQLKEQQKEKLKKLYAQRDAQRRKAQAEAKKRNADRAKILAAKAAKEQLPMSANKRRHLGDKKK